MIVTPENYFRSRTVHGLKIEDVPLRKWVFQQLISRPGLTAPELLEAGHKYDITTYRSAVNALFRAGLVVRRVNGEGEEAHYFANDKYRVIRRRSKSHKLASQAMPEKAVAKVKRSTAVDVKLMIAVGDRDTLVGWDEAKALGEKLNTIFGA